MEHADEFGLNCVKGFCCKQRGSFRVTESYLSGHTREAPQEETLAATRENQ